MDIVEPDAAQHQQHRTRHGGCSLSNETNVQVSAQWNGFTASLPTALTILNTNKDNFAPYDADTIDDAWQVLHFGLNDPLHGRGDADPDSDGTSNSLEWAAGTDPLSAASKLGVITSSAQPDGSFVLSFSSVIGKTYRIQRSTDCRLGRSSPRSPRQM